VLRTPKLFFEREHTQSFGAQEVDVFFYEYSRPTVNLKRNCVLRTLKNIF
jgi:hypothetical protein